MIKGACTQAYVFRVPVPFRVLMVWRLGMYRFYVDSDYIYNDSVVINGTDVNHIGNVLRMAPGDRIIVNDKDGTDYYCVIDRITKDEVIASVECTKACEAELDTRIYLFQALPKLDKMELIIQKAVELGVYEVIPVETKRCVVKLDNGAKKEKKIARWQAIAQAAAKQSARGIIPQVRMPMSFKEALRYAEELEYKLIPYEHAEGMDKARQVIDEAVTKGSIGIFIGPEGGFEDSEVEAAVEAGAQVMSLGNRILRTETAGMAVLSILMFRISR